MNKKNQHLYFNVYFSEIIWDLTQTKNAKFICQNIENEVFEIEKKKHYFNIVKQ